MANNNDSRPKFSISKNEAEIGESIEVKWSDMPKFDKYWLGLYRKSDVPDPGK